MLPSRDTGLLFLLQSLLNALKSLDLSHNKIQECAEFLKVSVCFFLIKFCFVVSFLALTICVLILSQPLSELEHLNLGYNCLQRSPTLSLSARAKLLTLNLRNNELETINGKVD